MMLPDGHLGTRVADQAEPAQRKKCSGLVGLFPTANPDRQLWSLRHSLARFGKLPEKTKFWQSKEDRALISFRNVQTSIF